MDAVKSDPPRPRVDVTPSSVDAMKPPMTTTLSFASPGSFPASLDALINNPQIKGWNGPYLKNQSNVPLDPWGHPYTYTQPGTNGHDYDIMSAGPDGKNSPITNTTATGG